MTILRKYEGHKTGQDQERRRAQDEDSPVQHVRTRFTLGVRGAVTHHALRFRWQRQRQEQNRNQQEAFQNAGLMLGMRVASPRKTSIRMMQKISIGKRVRNRLSFSNFKCMK